MTLKANDRGAKAPAGDLLARDPGQYSSSAPRRQTRRKLERQIIVDRQGDGFTVTIDPHPSIAPGKVSLNRRFPDHRSAVSYAAGTQAVKGWAVIDRTSGAAAVGDPARSFGDPTIYIEEAAGRCVVTISPRPWGCREAAREFLGLDAASAHAGRLSIRYRQGTAPLRIVMGAPR